MNNETKIPIILKNFLEHKKLDYETHPDFVGKINVKIEVVFTMGFGGVKDFISDMIVRFDVHDNRFDISDQHQMFKRLQTEYEIFERKYKIERLLN